MASFYTDATKHWAPSSPDDLNHCNDLYQDVAPEFDPKHPGFRDEAYKKRRAEVTNLATQYKIGQPIPTVEYTAEEIALWDKVYSGLREAHPKYACKEYIQGVEDLEQEGLIGMGFIPSVAALSAYLNSKTGFQLRPIGGYVEPRDFLAHLAFRYFPCTQYIRHPKNIDYSPDPDGIHDMVGHLPMFLNKELADLTQKIGQISLGASDEVIKKLTSLYWFTVEVGLTNENGVPKIYGAAVLSSVSEMEYALGNRVPVDKFDPKIVSDKQFDPTNYQEVYYMADSLATAMDQVSEFGSDVRGHRKVSIMPKPGPEIIGAPVQNGV
jgi:phenylalanine-4-hydroxylase